MRPIRLVYVVLLLCGVGCATNQAEPFPVTMAIDRAGSQMNANLFTWFDQHPYFTSVLAGVGTALIIAGALALYLWASSHDTSN